MCYLKICLCSDNYSATPRLYRRREWTVLFCNKSLGGKAWREAALSWRFKKISDVICRFLDVIQCNVIFFASVITNRRKYMSFNQGSWRSFVEQWRKVGRIWSNQRQFCRLFMCKNRKRIALVHELLSSAWTVCLSVTSRLITRATRSLLIYITTDLQPVIYYSTIHS